MGRAPDRICHAGLQPQACMMSASSGVDRRKKHHAVCSVTWLIRCVYLGQLHYSLQKPTVNCSSHWRGTRVVYVLYRSVRSWSRCVWILVTIVYVIYTLVAVFGDGVSTFVWDKMIGSILRRTDTLLHTIPIQHNGPHLPKLSLLPIATNQSTAFIKK